MKKLIVFFLILLNFSCFYLRSDDDGGEPFESAYEAIVFDRETFEKSTVLTESKAHESTGRIYLKDNYLIINELNKGFHIYNNTDPENPVNIGFLKVLGSTNLSIKNNLIYVNNAVDLIAIKIDTDFNTIEVTKRVKNVFPEKISPDGYTNNTNDIVIDWVLKTN